jgi:DNA-binding LacI/PurR family transcriptional regulator
MIRNEDGVPYLDKQTLKSIIDLRPESLLVIGSIPKIELLEELPKNLPIIIASGVPIGIPRAQTVRSDETVAMRLVVDHLVELGHKNIAHISGVTNVVAKERAAGYENAMKENGLSKNINIAQAKTDDEVAGFAMTEKLLKSDNPPTAIACFNDLQAIGAQDAIIKMKANVALVGYDNTYLSSLEQINLTTVDPGNREIADKCADLLLSDELSSHFIHTSTPTLVVRNSTTKVKK